MPELDAEERQRIAAHANYVLELLHTQYGVRLSDVAEAVKWVQEHKMFVARLKSGSAMSIILTVLGAGLLALWEGVKALVVPPPH